MALHGRSTTRPRRRPERQAEGHQDLALRRFGHIERPPELIGGSGVTVSGSGETGCVSVGGCVAVGVSGVAVGFLGFSGGMGFPGSMSSCGPGSGISRSSRLFPWAYALRTPAGEIGADRIPPSET